MKTISYVDYTHSYAHAIAPKLKAINYNANVLGKPVNYIKAIIKNALKANPVVWTDKEQYFFDTAMSHVDSKELYFYCKNAVNKAKETFVDVDDDGELIK